MVEIIKAEGKRIFNVKTLLIFLTVIIVFSVYSSYSATRTYYIPGINGESVSWQENLAHGKENLQGQIINPEYLAAMKDQTVGLIYMDETNLAELIFMNYDGKRLEALSDADISNFYAKRLANIRTMLEEDQNAAFTQEEINLFLQKAGEVSEIAVGYAEGWKVLNRDMGGFVSVLLVVIAVILLPLIGVDTKTNMKELCRSTMCGKRQLDRARIILAYVAGSLMYLLGIILFLVIKMVPFGWEGWNQGIQSNGNMLFSLYNITNLQQFSLNCMIGYVGLLFVISLTLLITVFMDAIMPSGVVLVFFWLLLLVFDQFSLWPVNHFWANFMPLRMTAFSHYYIGNETYRVFGYSISCMNWSICVAGLLSVVLLLSVIGYEKVKRRKGMY